MNMLADSGDLNKLLMSEKLKITATFTFFNEEFYNKWEYLIYLLSWKPASTVSVCVHEREKMGL